MATITFSLSGSSVVNGNKSWTISDADVQILIDYMALKFGTRPGPMGPSTPLPPGQALAAWVTDFIVGTKNEIQRAKTREAQAAVSVAPITIV